MNYRLYASAMQTLASFGYPRRRLLGTTADGYIKQVLHSKADYVINIDEDAFVTDPEALADLLDYCIRNGIVNCGMPDGGVSRMRTHNPLVTNPFFNIFSIRNLRAGFSEAKLREYSVHRPEYEAKAPKELLKTDVAHCYDYFEPYCPFFVWTSQECKTLYLDARQHADGWSTVLLNHEGKPFLVHTWYSRAYGQDPFHTARIDAIISQYSQRTPSNRFKAFEDWFAYQCLLPVRKKIEKYRAKLSSGNRLR